MKQPCVYILANQKNGVLYVGVTSDLAARVAQHRAGSVAGFTDQFRVKHLVWFERHDRMEPAIVREKQIKRWRRQWKINLIESTNPAWADLFDTLF